MGLSSGSGASGLKKLLETTTTVRWQTMPTIVSATYQSLGTSSSIVVPLGTYQTGDYVVINWFAQSSYLTYPQNAGGTSLGPGNLPGWIFQYTENATKSPITATSGQSWHNKTVRNAVLGQYFKESNDSTSGYANYFAFNGGGWSYKKMTDTTQTAMNFQLDTSPGTAMAAMVWVLRGVQAPVADDWEDQAPAAVLAPPNQVGTIMSVPQRVPRFPALRLMGTTFYANVGTAGSLPTLSGYTFRGSLSGGSATLPTRANGGYQFYYWDGPVYPGMPSTALSLDTSTGSNGGATYLTDMLFGGYSFPSQAATHTILGENFVDYLQVQNPSATETKYWIVRGNANTTSYVEGSTSPLGVSNIGGAFYANGDTLTLVQTDNGSQDLKVLAVGRQVK